VGAVDVDWHRIEVRDLRIRADRPGPRGWPAGDELRAERVTLTPDLRSVFSGRWRVGQVRIDKAYVSLHRTRDGRLHVLPALLERPPAAQGSGSPAAAPLVMLDQVQLRDAEVDLYDASVRQPAHRVRLAQLQVDVRDLNLPALDQPVSIEIDGVLKGPQRDGRLKIEGSVTPASRDAALRAEVHGVDLVALEPYLLTVAEGGVRRGALDLRLKADVRRNQLAAPGTLTLRQAELKPGGSMGGVPQRAVLAAMAKNGRIDLDFTLAGRLDDPAFSLNEDFATRIASAMAEQLGVSVGGVVEGVGGVIKGLFGR